MDEFEESVGYKSLLFNGFPTKKAARAMPSGALLELAKQLLDASLAEILRTDGQCHWQVNVQECAAWIAGNLASSKAMGRRIATMLAAHYREQYRMPAPVELVVYLQARGLPVRLIGMDQLYYFAGLALPKLQAEPGLWEAIKALCPELSQAVEATFDGEWEQLVFTWHVSSDAFRMAEHMEKRRIDWQRGESGGGG